MFEKWVRISCDLVYGKRYVQGCEQGQKFTIVEPKDAFERMAFQSWSDIVRCCIWDVHPQITDTKCVSKKKVRVGTGQNLKWIEGFTT
jgi:hypothetical protein